MRRFFKDSRVINYTRVPDFTRGWALLGHSHALAPALALALGAAPVAAPFTAWAQPASAKTDVKKDLEEAGFEVTDRRDDFIRLVTIAWMIIAGPTKE